MTFKDEVYADAYQETIDQTLAKMKASKIQEGIEDLFDDESALLGVTGPELILMAGFLKAVYLIERLETDRADLKMALTLAGVTREV